MVKHLIFWGLLFIAIMTTRAGAAEQPPHPMPPVTVRSRPESQDLIGPYNQPRWSARGRFSTDTEVYVIPPGLFYVDLDYQGTIARHGKNVHLFTQEFEVGLPYRFQFAYENNVEVRGKHTQVTLQTIEARYALADWGKIPLNPTLFAEYKIGVGKDRARQAESDEGDELDERAERGEQEEQGEHAKSVPSIPDAFEVRLLLGEQFGTHVQWALNLFHEQELWGEKEWETGFSQALTYAIHDEYLKAGLEMQFIRRTDEESRSHPKYEFTVGPNFTWKPSRRTRLDLAALFGTTADSPIAHVFAVFSVFFGKGDEEAEVSTPVSTKNR